jgi:hypothetical protein
MKNLPNFTFCVFSLMYQEQALPMIPRGASFKEIIVEGDGQTIY